MMKQNITVMINHSDVRTMYLNIDMLTLLNVHYVTKILV